MPVLQLSSGEDDSNKNNNDDDTDPADTDSTDVSTELAPTQVTSTPYQAATTNVHPYLSAMVNYTCPMKFQVGQGGDDRVLVCDHKNMGGHECHMTYPFIV